MTIKIYWCQKSHKGRTAHETRIHICNVLGLSLSMNVNRESEVDVSEDTLLRLKEAEKQGYIIIRTKY